MPVIYPRSLILEPLVQRMAQHHWLRNRATLLQGNCFLDDGTIDDKRLALHLRYETTHERRRPQVPKRTAKNKSRKEKKGLPPTNANRAPGTASRRENHQS